MSTHLAGSALGHFEEGERLSLNGDFWGAVSQYDLALKLAPDNADTWWRKGDCLAQLRQSEATECWETAARLDPEFKKMLDRRRGQS